MKKITAKAAMLIRQPLFAVFNAFVDADMVSKFWFARRDSGLAEGETVSWYIGDSDDAPAIEVRIKELKRSEKIQIE